MGLNSAYVAHTPVMSADGQAIVFLSDFSFQPGSSGPFQVFVRHSNLQLLELASVSTAGTGSTVDNETTVPCISSGGTRIVFDTTDSSLVSGDLNQASDVFLRDLHSQSTELISRRDSRFPLHCGAALSFVMPNTFSSNGQILAFATLDNNFTPLDTNTTQDVFARDFRIQTNVAVSVFSPDGSIEGSSFGQQTGRFFRTNFTADGAVISGNGRFVAFRWQESLHYRLFPNAARGDVYLHDLQSGITSLVSRNSQNSGNAPESMGSANPAVSYDGSVVAFDSLSQSLVDNFPFTFIMGVYVRRGGTNYLASANAAKTANANGSSFAPILSVDSRWVVFYSVATDLTTNAVNSGFARIYAHNLESGITKSLSFDSEGLVMDRVCTNVSVSASSEFVLFEDTNTASIYRVDLNSSSRTNLLICTNCSSPTFSRDGQLVVYEARKDSSAYNIFVKDLNLNTTSLVSRNWSDQGPGNSDSRWPQISSDGRYVVFSSLAEDLVQNDTNRVQDIFARDLATGRMFLLSQNLSGFSGNRLSSRPILAPDGRTVAFQSFASDLVPGDYNQTRDVFVVHLGGSDSDGDGLDDDWELAYFNTLSRDGSGDYDGDGQTDRQEFVAGTDPTNEGSVFRVITITRLSGGPVSLLWSSTPNKVYTVEYKEDVTSSSWTTLVSNVRATGGSASALDDSTTAVSHRFYRVIIQQ